MFARSFCKGSAFLLAIMGRTPTGRVTGKNLDGIATDALRDLNRFERVGVEWHVTPDTHDLYLPCGFQTWYLRLDSLRRRLIMSILASLIQRGLFNIWQLLQAGQAKKLQKFLSRSEKRGTPDGLRASNLSDQAM